jgi:ribosomal protein S18 acetylase RimI-like enzyme
MIDITELAIDDYQEVLVLWESTLGIGLSAADGRPAIERYLERNPGMSFIAREGATVVGAVLCGHDGRRGFIHYLAVAPSHRRGGLGRVLVDRALEAIAPRLQKCHLFIYADNLEAQDFWRDTGWVDRPELRVMSKELDPG